MPHQPSDKPATNRSNEGRHPHTRAGETRWRTAITQIEPNKILIRGYPVDELMGRLSFGEAVYLLLHGELPTPSIGKLFSAVLVASIDHGVTPPSTLAARNVATTGTSLGASTAAGLLGFGVYHGGDIERCMRFLADGLKQLREQRSLHEVAEESVRLYLLADQAPPGFGHRIHTRDPRAIRLLQLAHELELEGEHVRLIRAIERFLEARPDKQERPMPLNVNGAIAAVCADLGFDPELGNAMFMIARVPGLIAHAHEERIRQAPMRQIDPKDHLYDGPPARRLPETRK
jgi:citrate synthase